MFKYAFKSLFLRHSDTQNWKNWKRRKNKKWWWRLISDHICLRKKLWPTLRFSLMDKRVFKIFYKTNNTASCSVSSMKSCLKLQKIFIISLPKIFHYEFKRNFLLWKWKKYKGINFVLIAKGSLVNSLYLIPSFHLNYFFIFLHLKLFHCNHFEFNFFCRLSLPLIYLSDFRLKIN